MITSSEPNPDTGQEGGALDSSTGVEPVAPTRWKLWIGLTVVATLVVVAAGLLLVRSISGPLEAAYDDCGYVDKPGARLADSGRTLLLETAGEEDTYGLDYADLICAFSALDMPTRVTTQIAATRALDGRVSDSWDRFTAVWSYHPNSGLNLMITID